MEIHQLRYFVEVAESGNFTRAAESCSVSQPTLSHQVRKLEDKLGEPLLHRSKTRARLTPFGEIFYERAMRILSEVRAAEEDADSFGSMLRGSLRIGAIPTIAPYLLPEMAGSFIETNRNIQIGVSEDVTHRLLEQMKMGKLDFALLSPPLDGDEWNLLELERDELLVTLPANHVLAGEQTIDLDSLLTHPLVLMQEAHCLSKQALQVCEQAGRTPRVSIRSSQLETVQALVELGLGVSFTPAMALPRLSSRKVCHLSIAPTPVYRRIALAWLDHGSPTLIATAFKDHVRNAGVWE
ncbi:MAG: LysR substrate-binding domain-containing protein, partial [Opitutales bacterium]